MTSQKRVFQWSTYPCLTLPVTLQHFLGVYKSSTMCWNGTWTEMSEIHTKMCLGKTQSNRIGGKYKRKFDINIKINGRGTGYEYADGNGVGHVRIRRWPLVDVFVNQRFRRKGAISFVGWSVYPFSYHAVITVLYMYGTLPSRVDKQESVAYTDCSRN